MNLGDIALSQVLYFHFTTRQFSTGAPITSSGLVLSVYKDDSTTQSTAGITTTFTTGFDNVVGLVSVKIDTSADGTFYAAGHDFSVVITTGTSDSVSIVGEVVGYFSIQNRTALRPTTAGRTINIDSTGLSDSNVVKLGPTGSGTAQTARDIGASVLVGDKTGFSLSTGGVQAIWDALTSALSTASSIGKLLVDNINATISSRMATYTQPSGFLAATFPGAIASTTNITAGTITTVTNLTNAPTAGDFTGDMKTSLNDATPDVTVSDKTGFALISAYDPAKTAAQAGDAMTLTAGERISIGTAVWASTTRTLSSFGTLISDIWASISRTLTDKTGFELTAAYDAAKTAMQDGGNANIQKINGITITGDGQPGTEFGV